MTYLSLTLLDGTHLKLAYPDELELPSLGVEVQTVGSLDGRDIRLVQAHFGSPASFIAQAEQWHGSIGLVTTYPGIDRGTVDLSAALVDVETTRIMEPLLGRRAIPTS